MSAQALAVVEPAPAPTRTTTRIQVMDPIPVMDTGRFEQMQRVASIMARSTLLPETIVGFRDKNGDLVIYPYETIMANCFLVVNQAIGWSMDPFSVIQCVSVVHGRICYEGKLVAAVIERRAGIILSYTWNDAQGDALEITVSGTLPGESAPRTVKGTVAKWRTNGKNSPWGTDARKQLAYRGAREWERLHKPGTMLGVYTDDELEDALQRQERRPTPPPSLVVVETATETRKPPAPAAPAAPAIEHKPAVTVEPAPDKPKPVEITSGQVQTAAPAGQRRPPAPPSAKPTGGALSIDFAAHKACVAEALALAKDFDACDNVFARFGQNRKADLTDEQYSELRDLVTDRQEAFDPKLPDHTQIWGE